MENYVKMWTKEVLILSVVYILNISEVLTDDSNILNYSSCLADKLHAVSKI